MNLPNTEAVRSVVDNNDLFDAVLKNPTDFAGLVHDHKFSCMALPRVPFLARETQPQALQRFRENITQCPTANKKMLYILTVSELWQPKGIVEIQHIEDGDLKCTRFNMSDYADQRDNIANIAVPNTMRFVADGDDIFFAPDTMTATDYSRLFMRFCVGVRPDVNRELLLKSFQTELDWLKNDATKEPTEESIQLLNEQTEHLDQSRNEWTGDRCQLPRPYFDEYKPNLVETDDAMIDIDSHLLNDSERDRVLVVSGESGSGKTFLSAFGVHTKVPRLYLTVVDDDVTNTNCPPPTNDESAWYKHLTSILSFMKHSQQGSDTQYEALQRARRNLIDARNNWAWEVVERAIDRIDRSHDADGGSIACKWFRGDLTSNPLERFLLVVDEVGRDLRLAHGLVDGGLRRLQIALVKKGIARRVGLVLCGTSLDQLQTNSSNEEYLGSDPSMSYGVMMKRTDLEVLRHLLSGGTVEMDTLAKGFYSRIYVSNIRITNRAMLPFLTSIYAAHESDKKARMATQVELCSDMNAMKFVPSIYCRLNGLRGLKESKKESLFRHSFAFFLQEGLKKVEGQRLTTSTCLCKDSPVSGEIFQRGIATESPDQTSAALKFLATRGYVAPVRKSDGLAWETLISLHMHRLLECIDKKVELIVLEGAWPPAGDQVWMDEFSDEHNKDVASIVSLMKSKRAAVFTQAVSNAQSFDVLVLYPHGENNYFWERHQCKNWKVWPSPAEAFPSLGVDPSFCLQQTEKEKKNGGFEARKQKVKMKAFRSESGFERLQKSVLENFSEMTFQNELVIDLFCSQSGAQGKALKANAASVRIMIMTQEFYEPTLSACETVLEVSGLKVAGQEDDFEPDNSMARLRLGSDSGKQHQSQKNQKRQKKPKKQKGWFRNLRTKDD